MMARWFLIFAITSTIMLARAMAAPVAFEAEYRVFYGDIEIGKGVRSLSYAGNQYRFSSTLEPSGIARLFIGRITEEAHGKVLEYRLRPQRYQFNRSDRPDKKRDFLLDWNSMQVKNSSGSDYPFSDDVIDTLSLQAQLMTDLNADADSLSYSAVSRRGLSPYSFEVKPMDTIELNGETYETFHLVRSESTGERFEIWCAPSLNNLPVRVKHTDDDGKSFRLDLRAPPRFASQTVSNASRS